MVILYRKLPPVIKILNLYLYHFLNPDALVKPKDKKPKAKLSLADLQDNIIATINERACNLEGLSTKNTSIEALRKSTDSVFAEVESLKTDMKMVKSSSERHDRQVAELQLKFNELD
ncbi:hypothetical protein CHARACLAT_021188 [Characodon lateralis]|uniref:Uncharacterized protein n=1 Tax=Characodon lateralis TaxID=208331 RepID=A0ABU7EVI5_9TELE|nr:hypothetical protein [Characodon lateralis]